VVRVRVPAQLRAYDGPDITSYWQTITESYVSVTLDQFKTVGFSITAKDRTLEIKDFRTQCIDPAIDPLADAIDTYVFGTLGLQFNNIVGYAGVTPSSSAILGLAAQRLTELGCPSDNRNAVFNPAARWALADYLKSICNPEMARDVLTRGFIGRNADMQFYESNNIGRHTNGRFDGTVLTKGASQVGAELIMDGFGGAYSDVLKTGDIFTAVGAYQVKPVSGDTMPSLKQFVVTADTDSIADNDGEATPTIFPSIDATIPGKTCSASPTNDGAITLFGGASGSYTNNLAFHKNAIAMAIVPLRPVEGGLQSRSVSMKGINLLYTIGGDIDTLVTKFRFDVLFGGLVVNREMGVRIAGE
jgi:hypothetical protein